MIIMATFLSVSSCTSPKAGGAGLSSHPLVALKKKYGLFFFFFFRKFTKQKKMC